MSDTWQPSDETELTVTELPATFDDALVLLDIREQDEWDAGHPAGARHLPLSQLPARLDELNPEVTYFLICHSGGRSERLQPYLEREGYQAYQVRGGILAWEAAGRVVEH